MIYDYILFYISSHTTSIINSTSHVKIEGILHNFSQYNNGCFQTSS